MRVRLSWLLMLLLLSGMARADITESAAVAWLLAQRPSVRDGGSTPEAFAAWANARYLLQDALYLGRVSSLGTEVVGHLFVQGSQPVLVCWARRTGPIVARIDVARGGKLFARGARTAPLPAGLSTLTVSDVPLFVRGVSPRYLREATDALLDESDALLRGEAEVLAPTRAAAWARQRQVVVDDLRHARYRAATTALERLLTPLDELMVAVGSQAAPADRETCFTLLQHALTVRLRLTEAWVGMAQWQGMPVLLPPLSLVEGLKLEGALRQLLARAQSPAALRAAPQTAGWLREALADLAYAQAAPAPRELLRLPIVAEVLPGLLELEPRVAQNLVATAGVLRDGDRYLLRVTLRNASAEEATGTVTFAWPGADMTRRFRLAAGQAGELTFPLDATPAPGFTVTLTGSLTDGVQIPRTVLSVEG